MRRLPIYALAVFVLAGATIAGGRTATAASPWSGHWKTAYVHSNPHFFAAVNIRDTHRLFMVQLHDAIPTDAWNNPDCHGPAEARGRGTLVDSTHMRVDFTWHCFDGSVQHSTRFFRLNDHGDADPSNDEIVFCPELAGPCGLVFHRGP
jgi:hypothetical protein